MLLLLARIGARQHRPRFTEPEIKLTEQALALPYAQLNSKTLLYPGRQCLTIPQVHKHSRVAWFGAQDSIDLLKLLLVQSPRAASSFTLGETGQALPFVSMYPILHRTWRVAQQASYIRAGQSLCYQQHAMQSMVVSGFLRTLNLLLQAKHRLSIRNTERSHISSRSQLIYMRNYLCRRV